MVNNPPAKQEMQVQSLGQKDPYIRKWQSIFARKIPGNVESDGLPSMRSQRVRHNLQQNNNCVEKEKR